MLNFTVNLDIKLKSDLDQTDQTLSRFLHRIKSLTNLCVMMNLDFEFKYCKSYKISLASNY